MFFTPKAHLNLGDKFSSEMPELCFDFRKWTVGKVVSQYQNCSKDTETCPITESNVSLLIEINDNEITFKIQLFNDTSPISSIQ